MKKVGLITIHNAYNYGAVLQCTALLKVVENFGLSCEIIDYSCDFAERQKKMFVRDFSFYNLLRNIRSFFGYKKYKKRSNSFEKFMDENYKLSSIAYKTLEDFKTYSLDYDYCITGSDQTFCLHLRGDISSMQPYFLENVRCGKKISYASSFGEKIGLNTEKDAEWLKERLEEYNYLSVREKRSAEYVKLLMNLNPDIVLDPTLLLTAEEWERYEKSINIRGEYILFYSVLSDAKVVKAVRELAKKTGLKIVAPHLKNHHEIWENFERVDYIGPGEFLSLIKNAKYVVTTSFHGTVLAINYKKPFSSILLGEGNRISSILTILQLRDRLAENTEELIAQYQTEIDYTTPFDLLEKERQHSLSFLKNALEVRTN